MAFVVASSRIVLPVLPLHLYIRHRIISPSFVLNRTKKIETVLERKMQSAREKISNMASAAKEHFTICTAKVEEQAEKATARTAEERERATERRKAKEAQAKMEFHQAKSKHAAEKLKHARHAPGLHGHNHPSAEPVPATRANPQPVGTAAATAGTTGPVYPSGGYPPGNTKHV